MKKNSFMLLAFVLFTGWVASAQSVFKNKDLEITRLENRLFVVETTDMTTMYIVEGDRKAMLIDTGTKCEKLNEVVQQITGKPLIVLITHIHGDHAGNMNQFEEVYIGSQNPMMVTQGGATIVFDKDHIK